MASVAKTRPGEEGRWTASDDAFDAHDPTNRQPASLLAMTLFWVLVAVVVLSIIGLVLAVVGWLYPVLLLALAVPSVIGIGLAAWRPYRDALAERVGGGILPVVAVLVIIGASASSAALFSGEHLRTDRDPAIYLSTGRWLAEEGTLLVSGKVGGFAGLDAVTAESPGYDEVRDDGTLDPEFLHLLPVWGAIAHWIGGDQALLRVNAVIIAVALAALWLFAATLLRPWYAVLTIAAVAVTLPTVHFARDLYSEPLALLFIFGGLAFLGLAWRAEHTTLSLLAGLLTGAVTTTRIDGWLVVIAVVAYLVVVWWSAREADATTTISGFVHPALLGILISGSVGLFDGMVRSRPYMVDRGTQVVVMFGLLIAIMLIGLAALRFPAPFRSLVGWLGRHRGTIAWLIPTLIVLAAVAAFLRPFLQELHVATPDPSIESLQRQEGLVVDGTRIYFEWSMHWLSWYLGVFGLALAVIGMAWAWRKAILGRNQLWAFLAVASLTTAAYVIRPAITPDQLWAMRRYLPIVLPGLIFAAVLATQWAADRMSRREVRGAAIVAAVLVLVVVPASFTRPLSTATSYVGMYGAVEEVCRVAPDGSAVLLTAQVAGRIGPAVRSFCGVPVAGIPKPADQEDPSCVIAAANRAWGDLGVDLMVGYGDELDLSPMLTVDIEYELPEFTLSRRPDTVTTRSFTMNLVDADAVDASACA